MKIVRYRLDDKIGYGKLCGQTQKVYPVDGDIFGDYTISGEGVDVHQVQLLAPVVPSKAVCVGLNYKDHIAEFGMATPESPVLFIKPTTAVIGPGEEIVRPALSQRVDYEADGGGNRKNCKECDAGAGLEIYFRLYLRQRCDGAGFADSHRAVDHC